MNARALGFAITLAAIVAATGCDDDADESGRGGSAGQAASGASGAGSGAGMASTSGGSAVTAGGAAASAAGSGEGGSDTTGGTPSAGAGSVAGGATATGGSGELVDCNPTHVRCRVATPSCPQSQVPSVDGTCWGECVKIEQCACSSAEDCPNNDEYTCWAKQHCGYYVR